MKNKILTGIIAASLTIPSISQATAFGFPEPTDQEIAMLLRIQRAEKALTFCYMTADKDKNKITSVEEEKKMWTDMGYHLREYVTEKTGVETFEKIWPKRTIYEDQIKIYEEYLKNNNVDFKYEEGQYIIKKGLKLKKSDLRK